MKRTIVTLLSLMCFIAATADDIAISKEQLPKNAQHFLHTHFNKHKVIAASQDRELFNSDYTAHLDDGTKIEFNSNGDWEYIAHRGGNIPQEVIPAKILDFVKQHFPTSTIVKIERERSGYEVELLGDIELKFDSALNCIDIDR